jgi:Skp family chaperone for outer membrane proteins
MVHGPQYFFTEETMSISGLTNSALDSLLSAAQSTQNGQGGLQQLEAEFQQLGQDLQTGNLTQAQEDYTTLSENFQNAQNTTSASTTAANSNPITQAFAALSQSLQSGDLAAAQQDYATLQQDIQQQGTGQVHPHHHHGHGGGQQDNQVSQALNALSTALQSGNLAGAQSAFATLTQTLQQLGAGGNSGSTNAANSSSSQSNGSNVNVSV